LYNPRWRRIFFRARALLFFVIVFWTHSHERLSPTALHRADRFVVMELFILLLLVIIVALLIPFFLLSTDAKIKKGNMYARLRLRMETSPRKIPDFYLRRT
jgi:hypothetical protein